MRAELKHLDSPQLPEDPDRPGYQLALEDYATPNSRSFRLTVNAEIGPDGGDGADVFDFIACTPDRVAGLRLRVAPTLPRAQRYSWGKGVLVMREWSYEGLRTAVDDIVTAAIGDDWDAIAANLTRYMNWEFESYRA